MSNVCHLKTFHSLFFKYNHKIHDLRDNCFIRKTLEIQMLLIWSYFNWILKNIFWREIIFKHKKTSIRLWLHKHPIRLFTQNLEIEKKSMPHKCHRIYLAYNWVNAEKYSSIIWIIWNSLLYQSIFIRSKRVKIKPNLTRGE
jgi:hypothetical protein